MTARQVPAATPGGNVYMTLSAGTADGSPVDIIAPDDGAFPVFPAGRTLVHVALLLAVDNGTIVSFAYTPTLPAGAATLSGAWPDPADLPATATLPLVLPGIMAATATAAVTAATIAVTGSNPAAGFTATALWHVGYPAAYHGLAP